MFFARLFQAIGQGEVDRNKNIGRRVKLKLRRQHTNYRELLIVESQRPVYDVRLTGKAFLPETMTDHSHGTAAGAVFCRADGPAELRLDTEGGKEVCGDLATDKTF